MQFTSKPPYNDDPEPYRLRMLGGNLGELRWSREDLPGSYQYALDARPEFDRPQHNPANVVLLEFRRALAKYADKRLCLQHYIEYVTCGDVYGWPHEHRFHAAKVLTRLASHV